MREQALMKLRGTAWTESPRATSSVWPATPAGGACSRSSPIARWSRSSARRGCASAPSDSRSCTLNRRLTPSPTRRFAAPPRCWRSSCPRLSRATRHIAVSGPPRPCDWEGSPGGSW